MRAIRRRLAIGALVMMVAAAQSATKPAEFWATPAIQGYGKMHDLPDAAYKPEPGDILHPSVQNPGSRRVLSS